jgi:O-antigen/teichoic acid export membrane protein
MIKNLFRDMAKYLPSIIIPAIVSIIALPIITRLFKPDEYGSYVSIIVTVSVLTILGSWLNTSVVRFYPVYEKKRESVNFIGMIMKLSFLSILIISVISLIIFLLIKNRLSREVYHLLNIGIIAFILASCFGLLLSFLRIKRLINWYSGFFLWKSITALVFGVLFVILFHFGVEGLLWGTILSVAFVLPFLWKISIGKLRVINKGLTFQSAIEIAKYSFPLAVVNVSAWALRLSDRYMIQFFRGDYEVGIYSISYQISDRSIMLITSLFAIAFNPLSIIVWEKEGKERSQEFITMGTRYFLLVCIPAIAGISVLQKSILKILSTSSYYEGARIIPFVACSVFFLGLNQRYGAGLSFYKKTQFMMYVLIISSFVNIGLNFLFIPKYGYMAAAVTTLISYAFMLFLSIVISRQFFTWEFPFKSLINSICASAMMGIVIYYTVDRLSGLGFLNLIVNVCFGGLIYFALLFLLREFQQKEKEAMKQILSKYLFHGLVQKCRKVKK